MTTITRRALLAAPLAALPLAARADGRSTDTVRLCYGLSGLPLLAKQRGAFADLLARDGIKAQWVGPFPAHAPSLQAVVGGSADVSFGGSSTPAFASLLAGSPLVFTQFAVADPRTTAIIARNGSGIDHVGDLAGKSVAVNRSGLGEFLLVAALEKYGVDRSKVRFVYLNPPEAAPAFASGQVDAWSMWSPQVDIARHQFKAHTIFLEGQELDFQIDVSSFLMPKRFVRDNPVIVRAVNAAYAAEAAWASDNTVEAERLAQAQGGYDDALRDEYVALRRRYLVYATTDDRFVMQLQKATEWLVKRRVLPESLTVRDYLAAV